MKKILSISTLIIALAFFAKTDAFAQEGQFKVGGGLAFGTEVEAIGIQAGATYGFTDEISAGADFIIFFPENIDWFEFNANGHYKFVAEDDMSVYALAGLNYTSLSVDVPNFGGFGGGSVSSSEIGLNLGGGAEFNVDFALIYAELKYVVSNADQLGISGGLRFPI